MVINIDNINETRVRRIIIEFNDPDDLEPQEIDINHLPHNTFKNKNFKKTGNSEESKKIKQNTDIISSTIEAEKPLDFNNFLNSEESNQVSQEIIEKPKIPERKREPKIAENMQKLSI